MSSFRRAVLVAFALVVIFGTVIFILENQQPTSLVFLGWSSPELPASLFFIGALLLGMAIGPAMGFIAYKRKAAKLKRNLLKS
ncbi:lipopolysaccharide assembly protein LapA domain-containing protein [Pseudomonas sp. CCC3.1]|uniref:lipopolysaccharide assembly protein LapA domain-containing protein n=2 Tax=unclassified Pseudomonas TaxID=196821 RepID=UPI002AC99916|nr:lipopolysaccharide assembly protein LapA domain-containing protein [Pseudomonas sp. CCC3.1]MEB0203930.1 lipopolysaccharide assembly protein LapA domain-containing protein [Pseudomonas sp. CCC3.1]WPX37760.1 lipopolysaccharide assembly protein LapA domain-containing protein [Pseudomonas sp. CCC3.1]